MKRLEVILGKIRDRGSHNQGAGLAPFEEIEFQIEGCPLRRRDCIFAGQTVAKNRCRSRRSFHSEAASGSGLSLCLGYGVSHPLPSLQVEHLNQYFVEFRGECDHPVRVTFQPYAIGQIEYTFKKGVTLRCHEWAPRIHECL